MKQKKRLEEYLSVLEKEEDDILKEDPDKLIAHINLERNIINELTSFRKILDPLEVIYYQSPYKKDNHIEKMKKTVDSLVNRVQVKAHNNKEKLNTAMVNIKNNMKEIKKKVLTKSVYNNVDSVMLDING